MLLIPEISVAGKKPTYAQWRKRLENLEKREGYAGLVKKETSPLFGIPRRGPIKTKIKGTSDYGLYYDPKGYLTAGIGHLVKEDEDPKDFVSMTKEQARELKEKDLKSHDKDALDILKEKGIDPDKLGPYQKDAIKDMVYQMGKGGALGFKDAWTKLKKAQETGKRSDLVKAVNEFEDSKWARNHKNTRFADFKARMLEPVLTEQYGPSDEELKKKVPLKQKLQEAIKQPEKEQEPELKGMSRSLKDSLSLLSDIKPGELSPEKRDAVLDLNKNIGKQIEEAPKVAMVKQESDGAFMRPEEEEIKKKTEAALKEMTPSVVERTIKEEAPTQKVAEKQVLENQEQAVQKMQNPELPKKPSGSVSDQFKEALSFFAPTMIGALGGALFEGTEGAVAGAEAGTSLGESFRKFQLEKAKLDKSKSASPLEVAKFKLSQDRLEQSKQELEEQRKRTDNLEEDRKLRREIKDIEMVKSDKTAFKQQAEVKEYLRNLNELQNLEDIVVHGKKIPGASLSLIARSISKEVGTLNEGDVNRAQVDPSLISSAKRNITRWTKGEMLPSDIKEVQAMVKVLKEKRKRKTISYAKGFVDSRAKHIRDPELRKAFFEDILAENDLGTVEEAEGLLQTDAPVGRTIMTEEQKKRLQELRAKHRK